MKGCVATGTNVSIELYRLGPQTLGVKHRHLSAYGNNGFSCSEAAVLKKLVDAFCQHCYGSKQVNPVCNGFDLHQVSDWVHSLVDWVDF